MRVSAVQDRDERPRVEQDVARGSHSSGAPVAPADTVGDALRVTRSGEVDGADEGSAPVADRQDWGFPGRAREVELKRLADEEGFGDAAFLGQSPEFVQHLPGKPKGGLIVHGMQYSTYASHGANYCLGSR